MSTPSIPHSADLVDNVPRGQQQQFNTSVDDSRHYERNAALEKCKSAVNLNRNASKLNRKVSNVNFEWYKQLRRNARTLIKSKSDATIKPYKMQQQQQEQQRQRQLAQEHTNKSVNRNGTISRNHFRGVPAAFIEKRTRHFLLSMTVSISQISILA